MATIRSLVPVARFVKQGIRQLSGSRTCFNAPVKPPEREGEKLQTIKDVREKLINIMGIERGYKTIVRPREELLDLAPKSQDKIPPRKMNDSFDSALIPLSSDLQLQELYVSSLGFIRLGRLLEDMDTFAGMPYTGKSSQRRIILACTEQIVTHPCLGSIPTRDPVERYIAFRHIKYNEEEGKHFPAIIVTVSVDHIELMAPTKPNADIRLSGHVCWVGKSSIEIVVWLEQENHGCWQKITRALFLMAARNATNTGPGIVNRLVPENEEEEKIIKGGEERKRRRQIESSSSLLKTVPDQNEQRLIHDLFMETIDPKDPTLITRVLPPRSMWMQDATLQNLVLSHPENRNLHNKVFGGFLMRLALEIAWCAGYSHSKHRPQVLHISDIAFRRPVDVGALLNFKSHVCYTENNLMQIVVYCKVMDQSGTENTTNLFHYTFSAPEPVTQVVPKTYSEAMMYLDGRRHFRYVMNLTPNARA